ncbi:cytochrome P450 [Phascolomyces articulosus]|uniref:Cytochrome P450 n=1 Tax=Phascolomyces articulosus TaxID=60185 RepID=A0AAD5PAI8_9FUNG|nr:cytochrome P450 [Phascolomyces articulosus]
MDAVSTLWYQSTDILQSVSRTSLLQHYLPASSSTTIDKRRIVLSTLSVVFGSYVLWRTTVRQKRRPNSEVKAVSGGLPFLGHVLESSHDSLAFINRCKAEQGPAFRIRLLGQDLYVVTGRLIPEVYHNIRLYNFHEPHHEVLPIHWMQELCHGHKFKGEHIGPHDRQPAIYTLQHYFKANQVTIFSKRIQDGTKITLERYIHVSPNEKKVIPVSDIMPFMISQVMSFCLAGRKAGTSPEFVDALVSFTKKVCRAGVLHALFPEWLAVPIIKGFFSVEQELDLFMEMLVPEMEALLNENKDDIEEPTFISKVLFGFPKANGEMRTPEEAIYHYPGMALAAVVTVTPTVLFVLYELAYLSTSPFIEELRAELGQLEEWTPESIGRNKLLDSLMREILRYKVSAMASPHRVMADATLSNGQTIPGGSIVITAPYDSHTDSNTYGVEAAAMFLDKSLPLDQFDPYRFIYVGDDSKKSTSIGPDYLAFGLFSRACPGRFFALNMIKYIVAELVMKYNITPVSTGKRPKDSEYLGTLRLAPSDPLVFERRTN